MPCLVAPTSTQGFFRGGVSQPREVLIQTSILILCQTLVRKAVPLTFLSPCFSNKKSSVKNPSSNFKI